MASKKRKPAKYAPPPLVQKQIRISEDLIERVGVYQKSLRAGFGIETTFSAAVRTLIEKGLSVT